MSHEEEDKFMRTRYLYRRYFMSYEEEDTCQMRRRIRILGLGFCISIAGISYVCVCVYVYHEIRILLLI
jgi:hypothetical protein